MLDAKDKIVLITGGAAGIGANVVRTFLQEDVKHITILDIDDKNGLAIEEELNRKFGKSKILYIKCDITKEDELENAFRTVRSEQGYIDVVINNAGILNEIHFNKTIEVNLTALVRSTLLAWDIMRKDEGGKGGTVINIASIAGLSGHKIVPIYSATKAAVLKFSTTLGDEDHYSRTGVRIISICFGVTITQMVAPEKILSFDSVIKEQIPLAFDSLKSQTTENAAQGLLTVYKEGKSGGVWIVTSGNPAVDVTEKYAQAIELFNDIILN